MPQSAETSAAQPSQPATLCILLPMGLWLELPETWSKRRGAMSLWRGLYRRDGWPWVTYAHLAQAWG
jgi:hypothetical protein